MCESVAADGEAAGEDAVCRRRPRAEPPGRTRPGLDMMRHLPPRIPSWRGVNHHARGGEAQQYSRELPRSTPAVHPRPGLNKV
jgi:hypothetical protein